MLRWCVFWIKESNFSPDHLQPSSQLKQGLIRGWSSNETRFLGGINLDLNLW